MRRVFGVPDVQLDYAVDALARVSDQIAHWNTRQEQTTSYIADGNSRSSSCADAGLPLLLVFRPDP